MGFAPKLLKQACDLIATAHRDSGSLLSRFTGRTSGIVIYVISDPELQVEIDRLAPPVRSTPEVN